MNYRFIGFVAALCFFASSYAPQKLDPQQGQKLLNLASKKKFKILLKLLSQNPDYINFRDKNNSPRIIHWAAGTCTDLSFFNIIDKKNIDINCKERNNRTPLTYAIGFKNVIAIEWLLKHPRLKPYNETNVIDILIDSNHYSKKEKEIILKTLIIRGIRPTFDNFTTAVNKNNADGAKLLNTYLITKQTTSNDNKIKKAFERDLNQQKKHVQKIQKLLKLKGKK